MRRTLQRTSLLLLALLGTLTAVSCGHTPSVDPKLLAPPDLQWDAPAEDVLHALDIESKSILSDEEIPREDGGVDRLIKATDIQFFGNLAEARFLFTQNNPSSGNSQGLCMVTLDFPDGTNMQSILSQMTEIYGEGSQIKAVDYDIDADGKVSQSSSRQRGTLTVNDTRTYLLAPSEHKLYWSRRGKEFLTETICTNAIRFFGEKGISAESADALLSKMALVELAWLESNVLEDGTLEPLNRIQFDARGLVYLWQMIPE